MKQVLTLIIDLAHHVRVPYLKGVGWGFFKIPIILCLSVFVFIGSSFKNENSQNKVEKAKLQKHALPFKGNIAVTLGAGGTAGTGVASHLGRFEYVSVDDASNFPVFTGTAIFTAASGDQIFTTFSGELVEAGNGLLNVSIENIITGGTGRFEGATGGFTSIGIANPNTGMANTTFNGLISY